MRNRWQRTWLPILLLGLVALGYGWYRLQSVAPTPLSAEQRSGAIAQGEVEYTNFLFSYSLLLPEVWPIEDISQPRLVFLSPNRTLTGGNEQALYEGGAVSVQVIGPQLGSRDAFLRFVRESLEPGLRERNLDFSGKPARIVGYDGYRISITKPYQLTQLVLNGPLVTRLSFQTAPKPLDRLLTSLARTIIFSADSQTVQQLTDQFMAGAKAGKAKELYAQTTTSFRSQLSSEQFQTQLAASQDRFTLKPVLVSMLTTSETITTRSVLVDKEHATMNRVTLIFAKEAGVWKMNGVNISTDQPSSFGDLDQS